MNFIQALEKPWVFEFTQRLNPWTVGCYRDLAVHGVRLRPGDTILDIGCGTGAHRALFPSARYTGVDINPAYIAQAERRHGKGFLLMDAGNLKFPEATFDHVLCVATCHHLEDSAISRMVDESFRVLRPGGAFHVIDPILPLSPGAHFKRWLFLKDRGRYQRTFEEMTDLLSRRALVASSQVREGPLHDVSYFRLEPRPATPLVST